MQLTALKADPQSYLKSDQFQIDLDKKILALGTTKSGYKERCAGVFWSTHYSGEPQSIEAILIKSYRASRVFKPVKRGPRKITLRRKFFKIIELGTVHNGHVHWCV